jgi:hypothetical protein
MRGALSVIVDHRETSRRTVKFRKGPPKAKPGRKDASVTTPVYALSALECNKLIYRVSVRSENSLFRTAGYAPEDREASVRLATLPKARPLFRSIAACSSCPGIKLPLTMNMIPNIAPSMPVPSMPLRP